MLNLMYITNKPSVAKIAENNGVDRIWVDLEIKGKRERQEAGAWITDHTIEDVYAVKKALSFAKLLVRINPWNEESPAEIESVIEAGADIIMLPMWKSIDEVDAFFNAVNRRVKTILLLETKEAGECLDKVILKEPDEIHIGLRDLSLSYGIDSIFDLYNTDILSKITQKLRENSVKFGIGGIGKFGIGLRPGPESILIENMRMGASSVILSRTFCNSDILSKDQIEECFRFGIKEIKKWAMYANDMPEDVLTYNHNLIIQELGC